MILEQIKSTLEELNSDSSSEDSSDLEFPDRDGDYQKFVEYNDKEARALEQTLQLEVNFTRFK